jgi:hypothetical protein
LKIRLLMFFVKVARGLGLHECCRTSFDLRTRRKRPRENYDVSRNLKGGPRRGGEGEGLPTRKFTAIPGRPVRLSR